MPAGVKLMIHITDAQDAQGGVMWAAIEIKQSFESNKFNGTLPKAKNRSKCLLFFPPRHNLSH